MYLYKVAAKKKKKTERNRREREGGGGEGAQEVQRGPCAEKVKHRNKGFSPCQGGPIPQVLGDSLRLRRDLQEDVAAPGQVGDVPAVREGAGDLLARLDPSELDQAVAGLGQGARDDRRRFGFALGADDGSLPLLLRLFKSGRRGVRRVGGAGSGRAGVE